MRVPLLHPVDAVLRQLLRPETYANTPSGGALHAPGYDPDFREPIAEQAAGGGEITDTRVYDTEILVPCQLEFKTFEELQMIEQGDCPLSKVVLVMHRRDLLRLGLLSETTGNITLQRGDRIERLEKRGQIVLQPAEQLYIYRIDPGSAGFGPSGYDLHIVWTTVRPSSWRGKD